MDEGQGHNEINPQHTVGALSPFSFPLPHPKHLGHFPGGVDRERAGAECIIPWLFLIA